MAHHYWYWENICKQFLVNALIIPEKQFLGFEFIHII